MIYFTKDALARLRKKFFYIKTSDGCDGVIYKQNETAAKQALQKFAGKPVPKYSIYSLVDETKRSKEADVYLFSVSNRQELEKEFFEILSNEKLNALYFKAKSKQRILILSDSDIKTEKYRDVKTDDSEWPRAIAKDDLKTSIMLTSKVVKKIRNLDTVIKTFTEIEIEVTNPKNKISAKDDMELIKVRRDEIRKEFEPLFKKSKDDLALLKSKQAEIEELEQYLPPNSVNNLNSLISNAENLQKIDFIKAESKDINSLKSYYESAKSMLENLQTDDPMIKHISTLIEALDTDKPSESTLEKVKNTVHQMSDLTEKIKG